MDSKLSRYRGGAGIGVGPAIGAALDLVRTRAD